MIGLIDAGTGNLGSFRNALDYLDIKYTNINKKEKISDCDKIILPGVGSFRTLMNNLLEKDLKEGVINFIKEEKPVAGVCHASAVFLNVKDADGNALVAGKKVTGFTNSEEEAVQLTDIVPFLVEDELIKKGGDYQKTEDWGVLALEDGLLITGQNPASSELAAKKLLTKLG